MTVTWKMVSAAVGIPAALAGVVGSWDVVGWISPRNHQADMEIATEHRDQQFVALVNMIDTLAEQEDRRYTHWECYEMSEELMVWLQHETRTPEMDELIRQRRLLMDEKRCFEFEQ